MLTIEVMNREKGCYDARFVGTDWSAQATSKERVIGKLAQRAFKALESGSESREEVRRTLATFHEMMKHFARDGSSVLTMPHDALGELIKQHHRAYNIGLKTLSTGPVAVTP